MDNNKKQVRLKDIYPIIKEKIEAGGTVELPITGTSMLPLLVWGRDSVTVAPPKKIKKGDIVFYLRDNGQFVLHRIIGEANGEYILCGDNQAVREYGITDRHIIAVVTQITRKGKAVPVTASGYRLYCSLWQLLFPVRKYILFILRKINSFKKSL